MSVALFVTAEGGGELIVSRDDGGWCVSVLPNDGCKGVFLSDADGEAVAALLRTRPDVPAAKPPIKRAD